MTTSYV